MLLETVWVRLGSVRLVSGLGFGAFINRLSAAKLHNKLSMLVFECQDQDQNKITKTQNEDEDHVHDIGEHSPEPARPPHLLYVVSVLCLH